MSNENKEDRKLLLLTLFSIPLVWVLLLGWSPGLTIMASDASLSLPRLADLFQQSGQWQNLIYRADILGGIVVTDIWGKLPIYQVLGFLGLSAQAASVLAVWMLQIFFSFIGVRATLDFLKLWKEETVQLSDEALVALILLNGFWPALGGRMAFGHLDLMIGLLTFSCGCSLILAMRVNRLSAIQSTVIFLALIHAITSLGQQMNIYSVIFGLPFWLALLLFKNPNYKSVYKFMLPPLSFLIGSLLFVMPKFIGMLQFAKSSDATRSLNTEKLTYSFSTATAQDWVASIPWTFSLLPVDRASSILHDIVYPIGPFVLLLFITPWIGLRAFFIAAMTSVFAALIFSMNIEPLSHLFTQAIPLLNNFRSPSRAMLPFIIFIILIAGAILADKISSEKKSWHNYLILIAGLILFAALPAPAREVTIWSIAIYLVYRILKNQNKYKISTLSLTLLLAIGSIFSFKIWFKGFPDLEKNLKQSQSIGSQLIIKYPKLKNPLHRVQLDFTQNEFNVNTAMSMGLSTMSGYWPPTSRFSHLNSALAKSQYSSAAIFFNITDQHPGYKVFSQLYNVGSDIKNNNGVIELTSNYTLGPAWFVPTLIQTQNYQTLATELHSYVNNLSTKAWLLSDDSEIKNLDLPTSFSPNCSLAKVTDATVADNKQEFNFNIQTENECPLVIAMNYSTRLFAFSDSKPLKIFPVNGAQIGVIVPAGTQTLQIKAQAYEPIWTWFLALLGLLTVAGTHFWVQKLKPQEELTIRPKSLKNKKS